MNKLIEILAHKESILVAERNRLPSFDEHGRTYSRDYRKREMLTLAIHSIRQAANYLRIYEDISKEAQP